MQISRTKVLSWITLFFVLSFCFLEVVVFANIIEDHQHPNLSVLNYIDINTSFDSENGFLTKELKLKVKNIGDNILFNCKMNMRLVPDSLTIIKGDLYFEDIYSEDIVLSVDTVKYVIDTNKLENSEIPAIWDVEFEDSNGKVWKNESIIIEKVNY